MSDQQVMSSEPFIHETLRDANGAEARVSRRRGFKRLIAALALVTGIALAAGLLLQIRAHSPRPDAVARLGRALPAIAVTDESGRVWDVSRAGLGHKTVIVFYSTSCDVCQKELPKLRTFPPALRLIMINEDSHSSEEIDRLGLPYIKRFYDRDRVFEHLAPGPGLPTILLVDEQAILRGALVGAHETEVLQGKLTEFAADESQPN